MSTTISPAAALKINEAVKFKLWESGLQDNKEAKQMAIGLAAAVRRIVLEDIYKPIVLPKEKP